MKTGTSARRIAVVLAAVMVAQAATAGGVPSAGPYDRQVAEHIARLADASAHVRLRAAEALGFLRAYRAEPALVAQLVDASAEVRRQAALSLGWCGGRTSVAPLLEKLDEADWLTRQAAHVALSNLTGQEFPFDGLAPASERQRQAQVWRDWWRQAPADRPPAEVMDLLAGIEINGQRARPADPTLAWQRERGLRALGALGGQGATAAVIATLGSSPPSTPALRPMVRAGIRAVGRLREDAGRDWLIGLLANPMWARHAAEALGDVGDRRAVEPLLTAYARFAKRLDEKYPAEVPADDNMKFPSEDRMLETPYWIAHALCRLPLDDPRDRARLRELAPLIIANLPGDDDTFMLYQPETGHLLTRYLLEAAGLRQEAAEQAFVRLGQPRRAANPEPAFVWPKFDGRRISPWLPCVCTEREDLTRLLPLLQHTNGWVRINAAKTIAWLGDDRAIAPLAETLAAAKSEGDYGWSRIWKEEEFNDPCPRWREALLRALGLMKATQHIGLITKILNDEGSVLEVRHAAAEALVDIGNHEALAVLRRTATAHPFGTVRQVARDALRARGIEPEPAKHEMAADKPGPQSDAVIGQPCIFDAKFDALLFIKGNNDLPNTPQTVEQADRWRQTYVVTDEGPSYRPGDNLYVLSPPQPDGMVTPLTHFNDGWVGEPELSWDAKLVIFTRREKDSLWWHIWRMNIDGSGLQQLTHGPYHHVGPAFLPDGRIAFASSRSGIRDEYHGYLCTALCVMNADGSDLHPIATNIGRDNEPALLPDGRIVFSRLEVFYSRNKTELTLHAAFPDGTHNVVLYGPERRKFWRDLDHGLNAPDDGQEAPLTHRVLRVTQPQPMPDSRIVVSTQGGLTLIGPRRDTEQLISPDFKTRAYTTPVPLSDGTLLCATTLKTPDRKKVDLGLYRLDPRTGQLDLIYNDPTTADYEPRPILARRAPPVIADAVSRDAYSGRFLCASVFNSQEKEVAQRGRLVRLVEGVPVVGRHETHTGSQPVWKNHGGTFARVLGTAPLAPDGSFFVELPADRLVHLQVLDSDRRVINNQLTWIYTRPGETKSCAGCHEDPHSTSKPSQPPLALGGGPLSFLPGGGEFSYRAKAWFKGSLPSEIEERTRTVHAVNLLAR
jgi:HEAT repeat protein